MQNTSKNTHDPTNINHFVMSVSFFHSKLQYNYIIKGKLRVFLTIKALIIAKILAFVTKFVIMNAIMNLLFAIVYYLYCCCLCHYYCYFAYLNFLVLIVIVNI